ncbi:MAG: sterol desaturase family protein [Pseudomonadota bacterium]
MESADSLRLVIFFFILIVLTILETFFERKMRVQPRQGRWLTNGLMTIANTATVYAMGLVMPIMVAGAAVFTMRYQIGGLHFVDLPFWVETVIAIIVLDFVIWGQHLVTHHVPILWRLHRVHHSDRDIDVTSAIRFHPLEIAFSIFVKIAAIFILGPAALAVVLFEILLNGMAMFNHANLAVPRWLDAGLRKIIVTPDMHRVHHSVYRAEHDHNFGFMLSVWDRLFGTYTAQPKDGHEDMVLGLTWQDERPAHPIWALMLPFRK